MSKEIIKRSRLGNNFLKSKSEADVKQRNYCVSTSENKKGILWKLRP